jgi:hypothetical protein
VTVDLPVLSAGPTPPTWLERETYGYLSDYGDPWQEQRY